MYCLHLPAINLEDKMNPPMSTHQRHRLKRLLLETVNSILGLFNEAVGMLDYKHWLDNPVQLLLFKHIFKDHFQVKGVLLELRPFCRSNAEPQLTFQSAYMRLTIQGQIKDWVVGPLMDMREMSHNQIHKAIDEDNWMVTLFGQELEAVPSPSTPSHRPRQCLHSLDYLHDKMIRLEKRKSWIDQRQMVTDNLWKLPTKLQRSSKWHCEKTSNQSVPTTA